MRAPVAVEKTVQPSHSRGAGRRRRLRRGAELWDLDRRLCADRTHRVAELTLTVPDVEPEAAAGWIRDFWARVRRKWLGTRYFCWAELQRRGAVHYHAIWVNPPPRWRADIVRWVAQAWGHGRTQVRFKQRDWMERQGLDYVLGYVKKMGRKSYQQAYDDMPRVLRTYMSQRLDIAPADLDDHRDKDIWDYTPMHSYRGELRMESLRLVGRATHIVEPGCRCEALLKRRRTRSPAARAPGRAWPSLTEKPGASNSGRAR